ncbi:hypothetical protein [Pseudodesulfovibrio sp. zrk46]|uniref:hypothetical protein n=1 Tax=Pseudodesulfovibrio sp. zrk46 TaxID=2725288 RepID=UPI0014494AF9|nr:hypothetical protein [Pseudodesulfovibrio sp. zrk46]QJB57936.1 hypothetical protein HFN16_16765 [Pseudodesulfovibrio sp. zrk46]
MFVEILFSALFVFAALAVVALFFCNIETSPINARNVARTARYVGPKGDLKTFKTWL